MSIAKAGDHCAAGFRSLRAHNFERAAAFIDKIFKGANPAELQEGAKRLETVNHVFIEFSAYRADGLVFVYDASSVTNSVRTAAFGGNRDGNWSVPRRAFTRGAKVEAAVRYSSGSGSLMTAGPSSSSSSSSPSCLSLCFSSSSSSSSCLSLCFSSSSSSSSSSLSSSLGSRGGSVLSMIVTRLQSTNQVETFSMGGVMSAPVGCRDIHGRMLARELGDGKEDRAVPGRARTPPRHGVQPALPRLDQKKLAHFRPSAVDFCGGQRRLETRRATR